MKRFDKRYIYCSLLSDFFGSLVVLFIFLKDFFLDENTNPEDIVAAIPFFIIAFLTIYLGLAVYRILYYKASGYALTETEIKCKRGVFFKKRSVLEYRKIHAINKKQNLFHRLCGIAVLTVDSGSTSTSGQAEIIIIETEKTVDALLHKLNTQKEGIANPPAQEELLLSDQDSLYRFTSKRKMLYTWINIVSTAFFTVLFAVLAIVVMGICKLMLQNDFLGTWGQYFLYAFLITLAAMLLFSVFSFIGCLIHSFVGYHNFAITKRGNDIQISYGLLEKHTNTFSYDRIKAVKISQGLMQRMLGFASIQLEVIGYTVDTENNASDLGVLVPFCKSAEIDEILGRVLPDYIPDKKQTKAVSLFPFMSWFTLILGIVTSITILLTIAVLLIFDVSTTVISTVALSILGAGILVLIVKLASSVLSYETNSLALNNGKITAYCGGFTKTVTVFMAKNLIAAENVTTPLRKKAGITSLVMHLKTNALSNEIKVHIQKDSLAGELEKLLML